MTALKKLTLITSFFESPYYKNRAPYNEQLFFHLKNYFDINIIRPIAWTDVFEAKMNGIESDDIGSCWNQIPIKFPIYYFLPKIALFFNGICYFLSMLPAFFKQNHKPDVFYTTWAYPDAYATMLLATILHKPYLLRVHGSDINDLAERKAVRKKIVKVLGRAHKIISPSKDLAQKIIKLGISKDSVEVVYSGVDKEIFHPMDKLIAEKELGLKFKKRILYIGNFKKAKGVMDVLEATCSLRNKGLEVELCLIGKGECMSQIQAYIDHNNLRDVAKIIGFVEHHKLAVWINASSCVCLPSYAEGVPNVLLETMACETNIVATKVGGIPEIVVTPDQFLLEPGNIEELVSKLETVLDAGYFVTKPAIELASYHEIANAITCYIERAIYPKKQSE